MTLCWTRHDGDTSMTTPSITNHKGSGNTTFLARFDFILFSLCILYFIFHQSESFFKIILSSSSLDIHWKHIAFWWVPVYKTSALLQRARYASDCLKRSSKIGNEVVFLFSLAHCSLKVLHVLLIILTFHN